MQLKSLDEQDRLATRLRKTNQVTAPINLIISEVFLRPSQKACHSQKSVVY